MQPHLPEAQLGEKGYPIGIRHVALDVFAHGNVIEFGKQRDRADLPVDNFLKPPQLGMALRCVPATVVAGRDGEVIVNGVPLRLPPGSVHPVPDSVDTGWWCYQGPVNCQPPTLEISAACARCVFFRRSTGDI